MALTNQFMFDRMMQSDPTYDGRFITGVLTTGIYCLPSCRARKPHLHNVRFFDSEADARAAGLRPCKKCKPDAWYAGHDPQWGRLRDAWRELHDRPADFPDVASLAEHVGVGLSRLHTLCAEAWQRTPADLLLHARLQYACTLLRDSDLRMIEVAFQAGFGSLSAFNRGFRQGLGLAPLQYRNLHRTPTFTLALPPGYAVDRTLQYLGRDPDSLTERVDGHTFSMGLWLSGHPAEARIEFSDTKVCVSSHVPELHAELLRHVRGRLGLESNPAAFGRLCRNHPKLQHLGLRVPLLTDPFEALCWIVIGQQVNLRYACQVRRRLVEQFGTPTDGSLLAPPTAARLAAADMSRIGTTGRKVETLLGLARGWLDGSLPWAPDEPIPILERRLLAWPGLGPWSVQYLLMRVLGLPDCVPLGDSALHTAVQRYFGLAARPSAAEVTRCLEVFRPWRSLASFHLWRWNEENKHAY